MTGLEASSDVLLVADMHPYCRVLGPGVRFGVWVQGCPLSCPGCVSPEWIPFSGGQPVSVEALAEQVAVAPVDGLTLSGGEPFAQPAAVCRLVERVRARRDLSVLCYTGYTVGWLRRRGSADQHRLLACLDLLIDGPYMASRHGDLLWRGSSNQRIHLLSDRHRDLFGRPDRGCGLQLEVTVNGAVHWLGVPPVPGFRQDLQDALGLRPLGVHNGREPR